MGMRIKHAHVHFALLRGADLGAASNNTAALECFDYSSCMMKENYTFMKAKSFNFQVTEPILGREQSEPRRKVENRKTDETPLTP